MAASYFLRLPPLVLVALSVGPTCRAASRLIFSASAAFSASLDCCCSTLCTAPTSSTNVGPAWLALADECICKGLNSVERFAFFLSSSSYSSLEISCMLPCFPRDVWLKRDWLSVHLDQAVAVCGGVIFLRHFSIYLRLRRRGLSPLRHCVSTP